MVTATKKRILVVEDEQDTAAMIARFLGDEFDTVVATNGVDGLALAQQEPRPDLVIVDIMMPKLDGVSMTKRLREHEPTRRVPIIFLTAKDRVGVHGDRRDPEPFAGPEDAAGDLSTVGDEDLLQHGRQLRPRAAARQDARCRRSSLARSREAARAISRAPAAPSAWPRAARAARRPPRRHRRAGGERSRSIPPG